MSDPVYGMLLAAGFGTRLEPLTRERPKPMLPVCGHTLVRWAMSQCQHHGITRQVVNLHHLGAFIQQELGDGSAHGVEMSYSPEEEILGTGGGIRTMAALMPRATCVAANAKQVNDVDFKDVLAFHRDSGALATLVVRPDPNAERWGAIGADQAGRVTRILDAVSPGEPKGTATMFTGIHVLEPELVDAIPGGQSCIVRETYMPLLRSGAPLAAFVHRGYFYDHSTPGRYLQGNLNLLHGNSGLDLPHAPGPLTGVAASAAVHPSAKLIGPLLVGPGVRVEAHATVGPGVVLGAGATVKVGISLTQSVVWEGAQVAEDTRRAVLTPSSLLQVPEEEDPAAAPR